MATTPETQPVPTPAPVLSTDLIREILNPKPLSVAFFGEITEYGYINAMLDAVLSDVKDGPIDMYDFRYIVNDVLNYEGCDWHCIDWDEEYARRLQALLDKLVEENWEVWGNT